MATLDGSAAEITVDGRVVVRAPGLKGRVETRDRSGGRRSGKMARADRYDDTLEAAGARVLWDLELSGTVEDPAATGGRAGTPRDRYGDPAFEVDIPASSDEWVQFMLASDEAGVVRLVLPERVGGGGGRGGGAGVNRYRVPRRVPPPPMGSKRGLLGAIGKKILKVVAMKALRAAGGWVGTKAIGWWESKKRPYRVRTFTQVDYSTGDVPDRSGDSDLWRALGAGPALMMVHGTFSRAHSAFGQLPLELVAELQTRYAGRVFAFDHHTLSASPSGNVAHFLSSIPADTGLQLDVLCHSRGGLVARELDARAGSGAIARIDKIVFVASPNAGTVLADREHMRAFLDVYLNLLSFVPDNAVTDILEPMLEVVAEVAAGTLDALPGLQSMNPRGDYLRTLNGGSPVAARRFALASDFEPTSPPGLKDWVSDKVMDGVFNKAVKAGQLADARNDLVVPTTGVFSAAGAGFSEIPKPDRRLFDAADGIGHTSFFGRAGVQDALREWLVPS